MGAIWNFYVTAKADGNDTSVKTGPRSKNGGMAITVKSRDHGDISPTHLTVNCFALEDGTLRIDVRDGTELVYQKVTVRG